MPTFRQPSVKHQARRAADHETHRPDLVDNFPNQFGVSAQKWAARTLGYS
jgi:hypothetical protein